MGAGKSNVLNGSVQKSLFYKGQQRQVVEPIAFSIPSNKAGSGNVTSQKSNLNA
jgi:hypothetical protein